MASNDPFYKLPAEIRRQIYTELVIDTKKPIPIMAIYLADEKRWLYFFHGYGRVSPDSVPVKFSYDSSAIASEKAVLENYRHLSLVNKIFHQEVADILLGSQRFLIRIQHTNLMWRHAQWGTGPIMRKHFIFKELRRVQLPVHVTNCIWNFGVALPGFKGPNDQYCWNKPPSYPVEPLLHKIQAAARRRAHCLTVRKRQLRVVSLWGIPEVDNTFDGYDRWGHRRHSIDEVKRYRQAIVVTNRVFEHLKSRTAEAVDDINKELCESNKRWSIDMLDRVLNSVSSRVDPCVIEEYITQAVEGRRSGTSGDEERSCPRRKGKERSG